MKRIIIITLVLIPVMVSIGIGFYTVNHYKPRLKKLENLARGHYEFSALYKNSLTSYANNNMQKIKETRYALSMRDTTGYSFFETMVTPCFVIYVPDLENVCISCVDYAINSAKEHFPDFKTCNRIQVITNAENNPALNARMVGRNILRLKDKSGLGIPADTLNAPQYFIVNSNYEVNAFFTPNSAYPELTDMYLTRIAEYFKDLDP